jgi:predicted  nucleic acid-binding Zn-ribbon protein
MKTVKNILIVCGLAAMVVSCGPTKKELQANIDSLNVELAQVNSEMENVVGILNDVQEGFQQINEAENRVTAANAENAPANIKEQLNSDIAFIQAKMKENRERIAELEERAAKGDKTAAALRRTIKNLKAELADKEAVIATLLADIDAKNARIQQLDVEVANLNADKNALTAKNAANEKVIAGQDKAMHTAWYVIAKRKVLKEQNILKKGDVMEQADVVMEDFIEIDIRNVAEIPVGAKKARLLSAHPEGSYEIVKAEDGMAVVKILDPQTFWSVTRYLVVRAR